MELQSSLLLSLLVTCEVLFTLKSRVWLLWLLNAHRPLFITSFNSGWGASSFGSLDALTFYLLYLFCSESTWLLYIRYNLYFPNALKINDDVLNLLLALDWGREGIIFLLGLNMKLRKIRPSVQTCPVLTSGAGMKMVGRARSKEYTLRIEFSRM